MGPFVIISTLLAKANFFISPSQAGRGSRKELSYALDGAEKMTVEVVANNLEIQPPAVQAAFHDCAFTTKLLPRSGCNSSIRLSDEYSDPNILRSIPASNRAVNVSKTACLFVASQLLVSLAIVVRRSNGPNVPPYNGQREDSSKSDGIGGSLDLPEKNTGLHSLIAYYKKGNSVSETL